MPMHQWRREGFKVSPLRAAPHGMSLSCVGTRATEHATDIVDLRCRQTIVRHCRSLTLFLTTDMCARAPWSIQYRRYKCRWCQSTSHASVWCRLSVLLDGPKVRRLESNLRCITSVGCGFVALCTVCRPMHASPCTWCLRPRSFSTLYDAYTILTNFSIIGHYMQGSVIVIHSSIWLILLSPFFSGAWTPSWFSELRRPNCIKVGRAYDACLF